jgi:O-acetyl-ADP-ribose deacetylase (regulator of RNase III)/uncharacterized protein YwgA
MAIILTQGDLLARTDVDAIVNTVNCVGVMGKGIALQFKKKWPTNFRVYAAACKTGQVKIGQMLVYQTGALATPHYIINFPTKEHWRSPSRIEFIQAGLLDLVRQVTELGIRSIAIPPLGSGNGGLEWRQVKPLIEQAFADSSVRVLLFTPTDTLKASDLTVNSPRPKMTAGRAAILKVLDIYREPNYGLSKIEVQKLAYFLQESGEDLRLQFVKHQYGPYADALRHALDRMDGHFIRGLGDGRVAAEIAPDEAALDEAALFIGQSQNQALSLHIAKVTELIEGFQSPFGMELLATVHWVATREQADDLPKVTAAVQGWNDRKRRLLQPAHIEVAWRHLVDLGWVEPLQAHY